MPSKSRTSRKGSRSRTSRRSRSRSRASRSSRKTLGSESSSGLISASTTSTNADLSAGDLSRYSGDSDTTLGSTSSTEYTYAQESRIKLISCIKAGFVIILLLGGAILGIGINLWSESVQYFPMEDVIPEIMPRSLSDSFSYLPLQIQNMQTKECIDDLGAGIKDDWITRVTSGYVGYLGMKPCKQTFHYPQYFLYTRSGQFKKNELCWRYSRWDSLSKVTAKLLKCVGKHDDEYILVTENSTLYVPYYDKCQTPFATTSVYQQKLGLYLDDCKDVEYQKWSFKRVNIKHIVYHGALSDEAGKVMDPGVLNKIASDKPKHPIVPQT